MTMQAIETRYYGPTNTRGSRIQAKAWGGNITVPYDYALGTNKAHAKAAMALCAKMGWSGLFIAGGKPDERGNVYVNAGPIERWQVPSCDCAGQFLEALGVEGSDWFLIEESAQ